ncbi:NRDE family protein [Mangrovivirga sp. M17]|uniref:NRDE family protein n=1 Tax=Mangrovivirga halotolerans TaxID=2993936 RepID=A0ABT3RS29_9BACT|nr:NRDE family protein [Mangrovivirga halotolerans]MCX2744593.1 NRDE family protein [Mangrovivirga halotolerans]
MCTVSFVKASEGVEITSNRDETTLRSNAMAPATYIYKKKELIFPKDPQGGGSWIGGNKQGRMACLLNGAFDYHHHRPPYRHSRGLVLLDALATEDKDDFINNYDLNNIEPFTLIIYQNDTLTELRWDERKKHIKKLDPDKTHLWASATLYGPEIVQKRKEWFRKWEKENEISAPYSVRDFHYHAGEGDPENDVVMKRGSYLQTVSVTSMRLDDVKIKLIHDDLVGNNSGDAELFTDISK